jgi:glycosyltransferase involved in cell wall biosynthesis
MDLVGEMLLENLNLHHRGDIEAVLIRPRFVTRLGRFPRLARRTTFNADRVLNRFVEYPRVLRRIRNQFDIFHLVDHSYSHLVHHLPPSRTIVTCHDLDTFQGILKPNHARKSLLFKAMTRRILSGLKRAAVVSCNSCATRDQVLLHQLLPTERLVVIRNSVHPAYSSKPDPIYDQRVGRLLGPGSCGALDLLHVGSTIPRKRIDLLLKLFSEVHQQIPSARLIRVGGAFTEPQTDLIERLQIGKSVIVLPHLDRRELAAVYRRATMLLLPSAAEGFGFPVVEAMACGTPVVASDIAPLREVGGDIAAYSAVGNLSEWSNSVLSMVQEKRERPRDWEARAKEGVRWIERFNSKEYASHNYSIYRRLADALTNETSFSASADS